MYLISKLYYFQTGLKDCSNATLSKVLKYEAFSTF